MKERTKLALRVEAVLISVCLVITAMCLLCSCSAQERIVTVPEIHEVHHNHTDSVIVRDSVIDLQTTIIRELDSASMAEYGIRLQKAERAWLVQTDRLKRELSELKESKSDTVIQRDSIPYPFEVIKEVPRQRGKVEWVLILAGFIGIGAVFLWIVNKLKRHLPFMS